MPPSNVVPAIKAISSLLILTCTGVSFAHGSNDGQKGVGLIMLVLAVFAVVQSLEGTVIQPKIMGDRVGLHPMTIIIALMAGTTLLGGILGGLLAIPLAAVLRVLMARYVWHRQLGGAPGGTPVLKLK